MSIRIYLIGNCLQIIYIRTYRNARKANNANKTTGMIDVILHTISKQGKQGCSKFRAVVNSIFLKKQISHFLTIVGIFLKDNLELFS